MNDYSFIFYHDKGEITEKSKKFKDLSELRDFFEDEVFKRVEFYVNSDGYYIGEAGTVTIRLDEDTDEPDFTYDKDAEAEYSERKTHEIYIELNKDELGFLNEYVDSINGGEGDSIINYKKDFIMTDLLRSCADKLTERIADESEESENPDPTLESDSSDWFSFTTGNDDDDEGIKIIKGMLKVYVTKEYTTYQPS